MTTKLLVREIEGPDFMACYFINGDLTGYSDAEIEDMEYWFNNVVNQRDNNGWMVVDYYEDEYAGFKWNAFYSVTEDTMLGCNIGTYILHKHIKVEDNADNNQ